jgi:hypothetical protein
MNYQLLPGNGIRQIDANGVVVFLPAEDNGTSEWAAYKAWLEAGNTPEPAPEPEPVPELTPAEKLASSGLTVEELKELLGI